MADVTVNGKALSSLSAYVMETPDLRSLPAQKFALGAPYGRAGALLSSPASTARSIQLKGRIVVAANTAAARVAAEHALNDHLANGGLLTVSVDEGTTPIRQIDAELESLQLQPYGHPLLAVASDFQINLLAPETLWRDDRGTLAVAVPATATRYNLPLGNAPSSPRLVILGAATTPTLTIRDAGGDAMVTLVLGTLTSSETLELDNETGVITKYSSGVASNGASLLTSGTFPFRLDPAWGNYGASSWPTVEISNGQAEILYAKRYW